MTANPDNDNAPAVPGRILRLKQGFNPNSSSIGTIVYALPAAALVLPAVFGAATAAIMAALPAPARDGDEDNDEAEHENEGA